MGGRGRKHSAPTGCRGLLLTLPRQQKVGDCSHPHRGNVTWPRSEPARPPSHPTRHLSQPPYHDGGAHDKRSSNIGSRPSSSCGRKRLPLRGSRSENWGVVACAQRSLQITPEFLSPVASQSRLDKASVLTQVPSFQKPPQPRSAAGHSPITCLVRSMARAKGPTAAGSPLGQEQPTRVFL